MLSRWTIARITLGVIIHGPDSMEFNNYHIDTSKKSQNKTISEFISVFVRSEIYEIPSKLFDSHTQLFISHITWIIHEWETGVWMLMQGYRSH